MFEYQKECPGLSMQRKDLNRALARIDEDKRDYFMKVLAILERDRRFEMRLNLAYLVIEGAAETVTDKLPERVFIERLYSYLAEHSNDINRRMFSAEFITNRTLAVHDLAVGFTADLALAVLDLVRDGNMQVEERRVFRFGESQDDSDKFPYRDLDET